MNDRGAPLVVREFARFTASGAVGTAVHYTILIVLVRTAGVQPVSGSVAGFIGGAFVNYALSYRYVFRSTSSHRATLWKFLVVALVGLLVNAALMDAMIRSLALHYLVAQVVATGVVLVSNYALNRLWTFRSRR